MVNTVEMLNMVWVTTGLKIKGYAHIYTFGMSLEGNIRKWWQWLPLEKETGRQEKRGEKRFIFHPILFWTLWILYFMHYYLVKSYIWKTNLKESNFHTTCRMLTDTTISPQGLFLKTNGTRCWHLKIHKTVPFWKTPGMGRGSCYSHRVS